MRKRSVRIGTALAALALAAVLVAATPGLAGFKSGKYTGKTSQDDEGGNPHDLALKVNRKKTRVSVIYFELEADPCKGTGGLQYAGLKAKIKRSGKFKALSPGDGFYGYVKGKFKGKRASGTAVYNPEGTGCDSGIVEWKARKSQ
jgi:hypothetical protein